MRTARIVEDGAAYYHVITRVVDRRRVFCENWLLEAVRKIMRAAEGFSGVRILTYCLMGNHLHCLLYVPERQNVGDAEFIRRLGLLYSNTTFVENMAAQLARLRAEGQDEAAEAVKAEYVYRMYDLGEFMKTLKQRISIFYNRNHRRKGTLWEERYKSILIEGKPGALSATAAYIDLNPVRAGIVKDPAAYRFSGYGEAMGGSKMAREGIAVAFGEEGDWKAHGGRYRQLLYVVGEKKVGEKKARAGFKEAEVEAVIAAQGKLSLPEVLRCRVRYFTDGAILGSRIFVEEAFLRHRSHFSVKREEGARRMKGGDWGDLFTARQLRVDVIGARALSV
jgi:REP element-mobilizing transposase RayT